MDYKKNLIKYVNSVQNRTDRVLRYQEQTLDGYDITSEKTLALDRIRLEYGQALGAISFAFEYEMISYEDYISISGSLKGFVDGWRERVNKW